MRHRTPSEIKAYQEGFDFCFERFCESLEVEGVKAPETIRKIKIYRLGIQDAVKQAEEPTAEKVMRIWDEWKKERREKTIMLDQRTVEIIKKYGRERDKAVASLDIEEFKAFIKKWKYYIELPLPPDEILEITIRKMACNSPRIPEEKKQEAREWLLSRGYTEGLK